MMPFLTDHLKKNTEQLRRIRRQEAVREVIQENKRDITWDAQYAYNNLI